MWGKILKVYLVVGLLIGTMILSKPVQTSANTPILKKVAQWVLGDVALDLGFQYLGGMLPEQQFEAELLDLDLNDFDFSKSKPKKKKDGSLEIDIPKLDKAKGATVLKKTGTKTIEADKNRRAKTINPSYSYDASANTDPFYNTSISLKLKPKQEVASDYKALDYVFRFFDITFTPVAYGLGSTVVMTDIITGVTYNFGGSKFLGGSSSSPVKYDVNVVRQTYDINVSASINGSNVSHNIGIDSNRKSLQSYQIFESYLRLLEQNNRVFYLADGISVPEDMTRVYEVDMKTPSDYQLPSTMKIEDDKLIIPDYHSDVIEAEFEEIEWNDVDYDKVSNYVDNSIREYDYSVTNEISTTTNNYYTYESDSDEPSIEDIKNEINIIIENNNTNTNNNGSGTGGGGSIIVTDDIEIQKGFFHSVKKAAEYFSDLYDGITLYIKNAVDGLESLVTGTSGLVSFLDDFFDWLPNEYKVLLSSSLMLGVVAFFLRR